MAAFLKRFKAQQHLLGLVASRLGEVGFLVINYQAKLRITVLYDNESSITIINLVLRLQRNVNFQVYNCNWGFIVAQYSSS